MPLNRTIKVILTALLVACGIWLGTDRQFYREAMAGAFIALALASVIIVHLRLRPVWLDAVLILAGTLFLGAIDFRILHFRHAIMAWFSFAGLSSLVIFGVRAIWAQDADRKLLVFGYVPSLLFVISEYFADNLLHWTSANHPKFSMGISFPSIPAWVSRFLLLWARHFPHGRGFVSWGHCFT